MGNHPKYVFGHPNPNFAPQAKVDSGYEVETCITSVKQDFISSSNPEQPADRRTPGHDKEAHIVASIIKTRTYEKLDSNDRPVIAIDIDGVMADFNQAMKPHSATKDNHEEKAPHMYNMVKAGWFKSWEEFTPIHDKVMDNAQDIPLNDHTASEAVSLLKQNNFDVVAVTARPARYRKQTLAFFQKHNIDIKDEELYFSENNNKTDTFDYDYLIDDAPKNIIDTLQNSDAKPVIYSQRYNQHLDGDRVNTMLEFAYHVIQDSQSRRK